MDRNEGGRLVLGQFLVEFLQNINFKSIFFEHLGNQAGDAQMVHARRLAAARLSDAAAVNDSSVGIRAISAWLYGGRVINTEI